jgi:predicted nuclease of predicted toxin-antitoxin system
MKLLFDENLSFKPCRKLSDLFPDSSQVRPIGLERADDHAIWRYAKANEFVLVTLDADFVEMAALFGAPPKVIWLRCGNQDQTMAQNGQTQSFCGGYVCPLRSRARRCSSVKAAKRLDIIILAKRGFASTPFHGRQQVNSRSPHNGILSCFFHGFSSFLLRNMASARDKRLRVACGMITSSR